mmetsp:Transcript_1808/g.4078  ORF Transcript_1808/g.4078 Transcript_1808/m.4078 type:complete len:207 (-) Transcript_1808:769-1389(-)
MQRSRRWRMRRSELAAMLLTFVSVSTSDRMSGKASAIVFMPEAETRVLSKLSSTSRDAPACLRASSVSSPMRVCDRFKRSRFGSCARRSCGRGDVGVDVDVNSYSSIPIGLVVDGDSASSWLSRLAAACDGDVDSPQNSAWNPSSSTAHQLSSSTSSFSQWQMAPRDAFVTAHPETLRTMSVRFQAATYATPASVTAVRARFSSVR